MICHHTRLRENDDLRDRLSDISIYKITEILRALDLSKAYRLLYR